MGSLCREEADGREVGQGRRETREGWWGKEGRAERRLSKEDQQWCADGAEGAVVQARAREDAASSHPEDP
eukprot:493146-Rhodomonas_salina.1